MRVAFRLSVCRVVPRVYSGDRDRLLGVLTSAGDDGSDIEIPLEFPSDSRESACVRRTVPLIAQSLLESFGRDTRAAELIRAKFLESVAIGAREREGCIMA